MGKVKEDKMSHFCLSSTGEDSIYTGVNDDGQWLIYWLKVSGLSEIRELSFDTNIFLDQIVEAKQKSREGIVAHLFDANGEVINTSFTLYENGTAPNEINKLMESFLAEKSLKLKSIEIDQLDTSYQRIKFEIIDAEEGVYTLLPRNFSWKGGEPYIEAVS